MTTIEIKQAIAADARMLVARYFPDVDERGCCLYLAGMAGVAAMKRGILLTPQAGTCYWPRVTAETDDGVEANRFGYEWNGDPASAKRATMRPGIVPMPEMHVWCADPVAREIVDLSSGLFPKQCERIIGLPWKAPLPPDFFWGQAVTAPRGVLYDPNREATTLATLLIHESLDMLPTKADGTFADQLFALRRG